MGAERPDAQQRISHRQHSRRPTSWWPSRARSTAGSTSRWPPAAVASLVHAWNYVPNSLPAQAFNSRYAGYLRGELRQPLWAGRGRDFTEVAGPISSINPNPGAAWRSPGWTRTSRWPSSNRGFNCCSSKRTKSTGTCGSPTKPTARKSRHWRGAQELFRRVQGRVRRRARRRRGGQPRVRRGKPVRVAAGGRQRAGRRAGSREPPAPAHRACRRATANCCCRRRRRTWGR